MLGAGAEKFSQLVESIPSLNLMGCSSNCIVHIQTPSRFFAALSELKIEYPDVSLQRPNRVDQPWLVKNPDSCGGMGVRKIDSVDTRPPGCYWQRELSGIVISALVITDSRDFHIVGINLLESKQFSDELPYVHQGAIANYPIPAKINEKIDRYVKKIIDHFKLVGVFGVDMIYAGDVVYLLEINPRISATYELYERLYPDLNLVDAHIRVCEGVALQECGCVFSKQDTKQLGNRIVFVEKDVAVARVVDWPDWLSDRPSEKQNINLGEPICTVFSDQGNYQRIQQTLLQRSQDAVDLLAN